MGFMRDKNWLVTLSSSARSFGKWKQLEGGDTSSDATIEYPGGGEPAVAVPGGKPTVDTITLTRQFDQQRDMMDAYHALVALVGTQEKMTVGQQALDYGNLPFGTPIVNTGVVQSVTRPKADASSDTVSTFQVVIAPHGL